MAKSINTGSIKPILIILFLLYTLAFLGCGGSLDKPSSSSSDSGSGAVVIATPASIKLSANPTSVKTDDLSTATITATVLDSSNAAIKGYTVTFSTTGGKLNASSAVSDDNGKANVTFSSGTVDLTNRVVMVTGVAGSLSSQIPLTINGSTITLSTGVSNLIAGSGTTTLTVTARDANSNPVYDVPVTLATDVSGIISLSSTSGKTATDGTFKVTVTAQGAGSATVTAQGLGSTATQKYDVTPAASTFRITSPTENPKAVATNAPLTITVSAPSSANVYFATTLGSWDGGASSIIVKPVVGGTVSALISSPLAGLATVQVYDAANVNTTAYWGVAFSAPVADAANMTLQADKSTVGLSAGGVQQTAVLTAKVTTTQNQAVGNAPVEFTIVNPTGGGETVSPVVVYTDSTGEAKATFSSGSVSSSAVGVSVRAIVVGTAVTATKNIVIGGTAGSVVIGYGSEITVKDTTTYQLPMAVQITDANGSPVVGTTVTLSAWPLYYSAGVWYDADPDTDKEKYVPYVVSSVSNEDLNENLILEPGEDLNFNGQLDPPNSSAGAVPNTVVTDDNGLANFNLTFLKNYSSWIVTRVRASAKVYGTETASYISIRLPAEQQTAEGGKQPDSTFNLDLSVGAAVGSSVSYTMPVFHTASGTFSAIKGTFNGRVYTYTNAAGYPAGTIIYDSISANDGTYIYTRSPVPVRIVVR